jgi:hypothetical protein
MNINLQTNCQNNYTLINKVIYNIDNIKLKFEKKNNLNEFKINDNEDSDNFYLIETTTIENIISSYQINPTEISLIKLDIKYGEENILTDLNNIYIKYNIPFYISFHYDLWEDKNLDRFDFLTNDQKKTIMENPFTSILFE